MTRCRGDVFVSVASKTANHVLVGLLHSAQSTYYNWLLQYG